MDTVLTNEDRAVREGPSAPPALPGRHREPPLRGRAAEQSDIAAAIHGLAAGAGDVIVVRGPSGIGKSRLLQEAIAQATAAGARLAVARTDRDAHLIPLAPVLDAFGTGPRPIFDTRRSGAVAADPESRYWLLQQLQEDLERAASTTGVVVVLDDLQWCDTSSLAVLRSLTARLSDLPVLWVVAVRSEDQDPSVADTVEELSTRGRVIDLQPLTDEATAVVIGDLLDAVPDQSVLDAARRADNVPLLIVELVRGLVDEHLVDLRGGVATLPSPTLPVAFGASVRETLRRLSTSARQFVQVGSTLGRTFDVQALAAVLGEPVHRLLPELQEALAAGVLVDEGRVLSFRHDVIREVAESMIPAAARDALVRQGVTALLRQGVQPLTVAARVADVAEPGDVEAADLLRSAALELAETDADQASALALRAAEVAHGTPALPGLVADVLPLLWQSGRVQEARALMTCVDGHLDVEDDARLRLAIARLQTDGSTADALRSVQSGLDLPGLPADSRTRFLALRALNLAHAGDHEPLRATLAEAREAARLGPDQRAVATLEASESVLAFNESRFADATRLITSAMRRIAGSPEAAATAWLPEGLWVAFLANATGDTERAARIAEANATETRNNRLARASASWMMLRTRVLFDQGELEEAKTVAEAVLDIAQDLELGGFADLTAGSVLFRIALVQSDRQAVQRYRHFAEDLRANPSLHRAGAWLLALEAQTLDAVDEAVALTEEAWQTLDEPVASMSSPADPADDLHLLRLSLRAGRHDRVGRIEAVALARAEANPENDLAAGIALHVHGLVHGSAESLSRAVVRLRRVRRPLVLASALEDLGFLAAAAGEPGAVEAWQEAARWFGGAVATRDAERVRRRLRDAGVPTRPVCVDPAQDGLTSREQQVVERVAAGLTTQQIASDLFISSHTVITHVRHVYAKWGVSSRRELAARFHEQRSS